MSIDWLGDPWEGDGSMIVMEYQDMCFGKPVCETRPSYVSRAMRTPDLSADIVLCRLLKFEANHFI